MKQIKCIERITSRNDLSALKHESLLKAGVNIVYIYFLIEKMIPYPKRHGNILYIGEAMRDSEPTGVRFRQHITPSGTEGADTGNNLTLSQYFHAGWEIGLAIYETDSSRVEKERDLIYSHIKRYGAPPIAQGKIPHADNNRNRTTHIFNFIRSNKLNIRKAEAIIRHLVMKYGLTNNSARTSNSPLRSELATSE